MGRTVSIGAQGFAALRERNAFYVDKTGFISDWWKSLDAVTLICRPRRFGKTLNMDTLDCFFSDAYAGRADLFEGLDVWDDPAMREEQGRWPVIFLSFAGIKETGYGLARRAMCQVLARTYDVHREALASDLLDDADRAYIRRVGMDMDDVTASTCLNRLCEFLYRVTGRKAIVLLDEYDTPMQEAWLGGYWDELVSFTRSLFNNTFKTNAYLERAVMTGVTRVSRESIFSDLNNLVVVTTTSEEYATSFGFTEQEVFASMDEMGLADRAGVKRWYDGFSFGGVRGIYNPWSVTNYLKRGILAPYWANSSGNRLVSDLIRCGDNVIKEDFGTLLNGGSIHKTLDEQVVFGELEDDPDAIWSLLLASGYLKVLDFSVYGLTECDLAVTNLEVALDLEGMVRNWFRRARGDYNGFVRSLLVGDVEQMNLYLGEVVERTMSSFDAGRRTAESFYHGFVLGLLVELEGRYRVRSNRESGFGRYDVMLEPVDAAADDGIIIEFKSLDVLGKAAGSMEDALVQAHEQIEERDYAAELVARGVPKEHIRAYGFVFKGKRVLVG